MAQKTPVTMAPAAKAEMQLMRPPEPVEGMPTSM
jgi:hypothetical protein